MITATCKNENCQQYAIGYLIIGQPENVECGLCCQDTELTDSQADPQNQENITE